MKLTAIVAALASAALAIPSPSKTDSSPTARQLGDVRGIQQRGVVRPATQVFTDWKTFKAHGVNLGGWFVQEKGLQPSFFEDNGASDAVDETTFCQILGKCQCGKLLEKRYETFYTTDDIDLLAEYGINLLRIPVGYWAFMEAIPGETFHHGNQLKYFAKIANYAILKGMHIIVDLHGLPGGQNAFDNSGQMGALDWWFNATNLAYTLTTVGKAADFVLEQPTPTQYTINLINEPLPQSSATVFSAGNVSAAETEYLNNYYKEAIKVIREKDPEKRIPIMMTDFFNGPVPFEQYWGNSTDNIVWDTHLYFFYQGEYSFSAPYSACYLAKVYGNVSFPVLVGEWSVQASLYNTANVTDRSNLYYSQLEAWTTYMNGGAFWSAKNFATNIVGTDGSPSSYYWNFELLTEQGVVKKPGEPVDYVTCE